MTETRGLAMSLMDGTSGLVTGAASGIGRAMALAFAEAGAKVIVTDINDEAGGETVEAIKSAGGEAGYVHVDTSKEDEVAAAVKAVVDRYGRLDWAVNNAGLGPPTVPLIEQRNSDWELTFHVDVMGVAYGIKHEIQQFIAQGGGGAIVNTASVAGLKAVYGQTPYVMAKHGVVGLTKNAALEYGAHGIRVNAVCPGMTMTPAIEHWLKEVPEQADAVLKSIPLGRIGTAEDQAQAALWLCSPLSTYVTGVALPVDGGGMLP